MTKVDRQLREIPNDELTSEMLPSPLAGWKEIGRFALTFHAYAHFSGPELKGLRESVADAFRSSTGLGIFTIIELRACLFCEQRYYRWMDRQPNENEMTYIRALLEALRSKIEAVNGYRTRWGSP